MEVHVTSEVQGRLDEFLAETGCSPDALFNDALASYLDELLATRRTLNSRYDDVKSGKVTLLDGPTVFAQLREEFKAARASRA